MKEREPRYRVMLSARVRWEGSWKAASVRNVSANGLLLCAPEVPPAGTYVELLVGRETITARAVWSGEQICGLRARDRLNFDRLNDPSPRRGLSSSDSRADIVIDGERGADSCRCTAERSRALSNFIQFLTVVIVGTLVAGVAGWKVYHVLSAPLSTIARAMNDTR